MKDKEIKKSGKLAKDSNETKRGVKNGKEEKEIKNDKTNGKQTKNSSKNTKATKDEANNAKETKGDIKNAKEKDPKDPTNQNNEEAKSSWSVQNQGKQKNTFETLENGFKNSLQNSGKTKFNNQKKNIGTKWKNNDGGGFKKVGKSTGKKNINRTTRAPAKGGGKGRG